MKASQLALIGITMFACDWTSAANITVVSTVGIQGFLEQVRHDFEESSGGGVSIKYGTAAQLGRRLDGGESFDVVILTQSMIEGLARQGKIIRTTSTPIARTGIGIAAKAGTATRFVGTHDALRSALLASGGIAYTRVGHSARAAARLFDGLGIAEEMKNRIYLDTRPAGGVLAVAEGKAPLGIALLTEIAADPRVELVAPLPRDLQTYVVFAAAVASDTKESALGRAFIAFLREPELRSKLRKVGMQGE